MSKGLLIVESDSDASDRMQSALEAKGFSVQTLAEGKPTVERVRGSRPDLIVLSAELAAGQSGYLICRELKKDSELKKIPVVITGDPEKFDGHRKLKTRAEEYVAKPLDVDRLVEIVGTLIGFPEASVEVDEGLSLSELVEEESPAPQEPEEISVEASAPGDADLDSLDSAFEGMTSDGEIAPPEDPFEKTNNSIETMPDEDDSPMLTAVGSPLAFLTQSASPPPPPEEESLVVEESFNNSDSPPVPDPEPEPRVAAPESPAPRAAMKPVTSRFRTTAGDNGELANELKALKARISEAEATADDANGRAQAQEARVQELEAELASKQAELDSARASTGKNDKDFFTLKDSVNKKDKEILRLKTELNDREKEVVELKDRETQLEQQVSESQASSSQVATLTTKVEQLTAEKRKFETQATSLREESRKATSQLSVLQVDLDQARATVAELEQLRAQAEGIDIQLQEAQADLGQARGEVDRLKGELERAQSEVESARAQVTSQATAFADEMSALRGRLSELEGTSNKNEDRVQKLYGRIRNDEKLREKTKKALSIALQLLEEQQSPLETNETESEVLS
jgi:CheY-like chemotaxis protein